MARAAPAWVKQEPGFTTSGQCVLKSGVAKELIEPHRRAAKARDLPGRDVEILRTRLTGHFDLLEIEYPCPAPQIVSDAPDDLEKRRLGALLGAPGKVVTGARASLYAIGGPLRVGAPQRKGLSCVFVHDLLLIDDFGPLSAPGTAHPSGPLAGPPELYWTQAATILSGAAACRGVRQLCELPRDLDADDCPRSLGRGPENDQDTRGLRFGPGLKVDTVILAMDIPPR